MLSILLLLFGVFCCSTSVLMIQASGLHATVLASYRLLLAALFLSPIYFAKWRQYREQYSLRHLRMTLAPAVVLALHFITWAWGAQHANPTSATLIVNMVPVVVPFLLFLALGEKITTPEGVGIAVSLAGVVWLGVADMSGTAGHTDNSNALWGDAVCFLSLLLLSVYLVQGRMNRDIPHLWLYLVPLYFFAGLICLAVASVVPGAGPFAPHPTKSYLAVLGLALGPTIMGHSILNLSMQRLSGQIVSVFTLFQFVFAGILAYFLLHETPHATFYGASVLVVGGAIVVIRGVNKTPDGQRELAALAVEE